MDQPVFASFLIIEFSVISEWCGHVAATTRPDGRMGLPGGKVDAGESPLDCAIREAYEEGWDARCGNNTPHHVHSALVDGRLVHWYQAYWHSARELSQYKEQYRGIRPIRVPIEVIAASGFGNEFLAKPRGTYAAK